jgi:adenylate cyclase
MTGEETLILGRRTILGSTLAAASLPWRTIEDLERTAHRASGGQFQADIAGERYVAIASETSGSDGALFVSLHSLDRAMSPYRRIQAGLLGVGLVGILLGIGASALMARHITTPVARLVEGTRQVSAGNYEYTLEQSRIDELGTLARSFNDMTRGLRERADMQKFVSHSTVEMIRANAETRNAAGERKALTVFFSDIRGFTAMSETRAPEEVVRLLNLCLGVQAERVHKFGGDIDKFVGDAVVALYDVEDMALQEILCAVDIQKALDTMRPDGTALSVGIGIATGEVVLGSIGGAGRFDYTAVGTHVNLAARLCSMAGPREILLAESTWLPVRDLIAADRQDEVAVRGLSRPVAVYRMQVGKADG